MKSLVIEGKKRESLGKKEAKRLRAQEIVPAVLYGGSEVIHFAVPFSDLRKFIYTPSVYLIDLEIDGEKYKAMIKDVQWHPVEEQILHIDFLKIEESKLIKISIPVQLTGMAKGIKAGGKLKNNLRQLKVKALAENLPDVITIDVTSLTIGQSIKVGDLNFDNLELLDNKSSMVVSIITSRAAKSVLGSLPEDEEEAVAEGEGVGEAEEAASSEE